MLNVFLSYSRQDWRFAQDLYTRLLEHDLDAWWDVRRMNSDDHWTKVFPEIAKSHCLVALFGPHNLGAIQKSEIDYAVRHNLRLFHILIPDCDRTTQDFTKYVGNGPSWDFTEGLTEKAVLDLATAIKGAPPPVEERVDPSKNVNQRILTFSGGSGSGTEDLCVRLGHRLEEMFGAKSYQLLPMSRYYTTSALPSEVQSGYSHNFDNPEVINFNRMVSDVRQMQGGLPIRSEIYDEENHVKVGDELIEPPSHFVLLHGVYLLTDDQICEVSNATFYVDVDPEIRLARRTRKNVQQNHMNVEKSLEYYFNFVKPAFKTFGLCAGI